MLGFLGKVGVVIRGGAVEHPLSLLLLILGAIVAVFKFVSILGTTTIAPGGRDTWVAHSPQGGGLGVVLISISI